MGVRCPQNEKFVPYQTGQMRNFKRCWILILTAVILAVALRLPLLKQRLMHTDEAVHAIKFAHLLEKGSYKYNPEEFHGPTLNYLTLIPAWLGSAHKISDVNEVTLRIVPAFCGILLVLLILLLKDGLGGRAVSAAVLLTAVSPAFVFYSRYYIQEMLLVSFSFGVILSSYRYIRSKDIKWAILTGIFMGLAHATKETCVIAFGSMLLALLLAVFIQKRGKSIISSLAKEINYLHILTILLTAFAVSALFYSSFLKNPAGILDSFRAYKFYLDKAAHNQIHIHHWYYYLKMLLYFRIGSGPAWSEAFIIMLACFGFLFVWSKRYIKDFDPGLLRFFAFYTLIMTIIYSAIPYKTPWSMLGFLHGMIILAGVGIAVFMTIANTMWRRAVVAFVLVGGVCALVAQAYAGSFYFYADSCNPYVYAHTSEDVFEITRRIEQAASSHPEGGKMYIQVICREDDYWPLPWYLRDFTGVAYQSKVEEDMPAVPVIIASKEFERKILEKLYELPEPGKKKLYVSLFKRRMELRPTVELIGFVTKDLFDRMQQNQTPSSLKDAELQR